VHSLSFGQASLDLAKAAASPGTEAKELFVPRNQISTTFTLNPELTFGAQYFLDWEGARLPEAGTYYSGSDVVGFGAQSFLLGHTGGAGLAGPNGTLTTVRRGHDYTPDNQGDWGLMLKWSPEWLDGTLGAYYRKTSDILPQAVLDTRGLTSVGGVGGLRNSIGTTTYEFAYGDDIDNMPLASIPAIISAAGPDGLQAGLGLLPARSPGTGVITDVPRDGDSLAATGDTLHWTINGLVAIADTPLFDSATLLGELYYSNLLSLDSKNKALYKGEDTYRGIDKPTRDNWGIAVNFTPTWYQVFPGVDLSAPLSVNVGIDGVSPVVAGGAEDAGNYAVGVSAAVYNKYYVDLKYVDAFGKTTNCDDGATDGSTPNALDGTQRYTCFAGGLASASGSGATEDRGAVYLTLKTTF
jgi:hypothetical protein